MDWVKIGNMHVKKQQLEPDMDQWTGSKLGICMSKSNS